MNHEHRSISVPIARNPDGGGAPKAAQSTTPGVGSACHTPPIDIHEGTEGLVLEADLPGVTEAQLSIQLEDNVLSLFARASAPAPEGARVLHEEYQPGDFYRSFILSDEVERSKISAE